MRKGQNDCTNIQYISNKIQIQKVKNLGSKLEHDKFYTAQFVPKQKTISSYKAHSCASAHRLPKDFTTKTKTNRSIYVGFN